MSAIVTIFVDLTQVSRSVVGKGDVFTMCALWKGKNSLFRCLDSQK